MAKLEESDTFLNLLQSEAASFTRQVSTEEGDWIVRGFIDIFRRVYTISGDTKVVSKLIELMLLPGFKTFAEQNEMCLELAREQNQYPDMSFVDRDGRKFAVDLKSTYRKGLDTCNTMTLGAYSGYFRERDKKNKTTFAYGDYSGHYVLGVVYDRARLKSDELSLHTVSELGTSGLVEFTQAAANVEYSCTSIQDIPAVVRNLQFFAQPKYKIARDTPGSGNTKNIGAVGVISQLISGSGPFASLGDEIFDDYWMNYLNAADARAAGLAKPPYTNLREYLDSKKLSASQEAIETAIHEADKAAAAAEIETEAGDS